MEQEFDNKSGVCEKCFNEFPKESYSAHKLMCETKESEKLNSDNKSDLYEKQGEREKNSKLKDEFGLDSVKSLRERLDKRLKAISETMDSISKRDLTRGLSSNRDRDRERFDLSSVDKKMEYNKFNYNNEFTNDNNNNILTGTENEHGNAPNFNTNETKVLEEYNRGNNLNEEDGSQKAKKNLDLDLSQDPKEFGVIINTNDYRTKYNLHTINVVSKNNHNGDLDIRNKIENPPKRDSETNKNLNLNNSYNDPFNKEDLNKMDFSNNTSAAGIELNGVNERKLTPNYDIEENFNPNEINLKNLINNEISKISHDNFNEEVDSLSDDDAENFDIKRKKFNNLAVEDFEAQQNQERKNYINIHDHEEDEIKSNNEEQESYKRRVYGDKNQTKIQVPEDAEENLEGKFIENKILSINRNDSNIQNPDIIKTLNEDEKKDNQLVTEESKKPKEQLNKLKISNNSQEKSEKQQNIQNNLNYLQQSTRLIHDESLLQKIETTNKQKYLEAQRAKEELEKLESELTMMQRLTHEKWQIRKNAFKQIADLISTIKSNIDKNKDNNLNSTSGEAEQELTETMETLFPWFQYLITDTNVIALCEGLNSFCFLFDFCSNEQKNKALILFFDELEKLILHSKNTIFDLSLKIILNALSSKKFANFVISEIMRKLNTSNNKILVFLSKVIEEMLDFAFNSAAFSEHYLKLLFEKVVFYFCNAKQQLNKNIERRKLYGKIIVIMFEKVFDDFESVKHHLNLSSDETAALEKLLVNSDKDKKEVLNSEEHIRKFRYTLYEPIPKSKTLNNLNFNNANYREKNLKLKNTEVNLESYNYPNTSKNKHSTELNFNSSAKENYNVKDNELDSKIQNENIDLFSVLPNNFFDIPFITALKVKKEIIEDLNKKLLEFTSIKDKDYKDFLNIVNYAIDDTNILVNLEGIKLLKNFCRLSKTATNQSKLKSLIISCYEKFKDKKTNVKLELFDLFNTIIVNRIFPFELFFAIKLQHVLTQKNPIVKTNLLEYVRETFAKYDKGKEIDNKQQKVETADVFKNEKIGSEEIITRSKKAQSVDLRNKSNEKDTYKDAFDSNEPVDETNKNVTLKQIITKNLQSKTLLNISKILVEIVKEDSQSQVKDLSVEILLQIKHILESEYSYEALDKFEEMISAMPNFRVNVILSGKTPKNIKENHQNFEKEYKASLNRIKSSISIGMRSNSRQKLTYKNSTNFKASKERNSKRGFRSSKNTTNFYDEKPTETGYGSSNQRKRTNNRIDRDENECRSIYNSSDGKIHHDDSGVENSDYEKPEDNYPHHNVNFSRDLDHRKTKKIFENKKSLEKNKRRDNETDKQDQKELNLENNQLFMDKYKKLKQKEKEKNLKRNDSKRKKTKDRDSSAYFDNSLNYSNSLGNKLQEKPKQNLQRNLDKDMSTISDISPITNRTDRTNLERKMDSAIEYISNLSEEQIFDYAKSVIRDFLIFIKKVTSNKNTKEDLDCHFQVILTILKNIFNQMDSLAKKLNSEKTKNFIPEEIFIQSFKIIVVAPCFLLDVDNHLLPFIKKIRTTMENDKRFAEIYFAILNKFVSFEKRSSFLQGVDSKNSFTVFYDFFLYDDPAFEDIFILEKFKLHILKNVFLNEEEKKKYVKEFSQAVKIIEITHKDEINKEEERTIEIDDYRKQKEQTGNSGIEDKEDLQEDKSKTPQRQRSEEKKKFKIKGPNDFTPEASSKNENQKAYIDKHKKEEEENEEDLIIKNYGKIFNNKQNTLANSIEKQDLKVDVSASFEKDKSQRIKNLNNIKTAPTLTSESYNAICKTEISNNINDTGLPVNLDKDILKIKDSIKEKCRKLDMNIKRINSKIEGEAQPSIKITEYQTAAINTSKTQRDMSESYNFKQQNNLQQSEEIDNSNLKVQRSQDIYSVYNLPKFNHQMQDKTIINPPITDKSGNEFSSVFGSKTPSYDFSQRNLPYFNFANDNSFQMNPNQNLKAVKVYNMDQLKKLILKIPTIILDDCVSEISHYVLLENSFTKINSDMKIEFANFLACSINNGALIKTSSFNCFLQLMEFLLSLLIYEMKNNLKNNDPNSRKIVLKLQETIEKIMKHKTFTEIFKILIFLLRKYLPKDFSAQISRDNLIYLKTISYLFKISLEEKIKQQACVSTFEIISEINDLFLVYSPANLNPNIPNLEDLDKIYKLMRLLTDEAINDLKDPSLLKTFLENVKRSGSNEFCNLYMQYLENNLNSILDRSE